MPANVSVPGVGACPAKDAQTATQDTEESSSSGINDAADDLSPSRRPRSRRGDSFSAVDCSTPSTSSSEERHKIRKTSSSASRFFISPAECSTTPCSSLKSMQREILWLAYKRGGLKFGSFTLKSGRQSPFFFNSGCFTDGKGMELLAKAYALKLVESGVSFDVLFGPAYKGISLVACTALVLARDYGLSAPFVYDRKEPKDHGEGGQLIGAVEALTFTPLPTSAAETQRSCISSSSGNSSIGSSSSSEVKGNSSKSSQADTSSSSKSNKAERSGSSSSESEESSSSSNSSETKDSSRSSNSGAPGSSTSSSNRSCAGARVVVVDDVLTAGKAIRGSVNLLKTSFPDITISALCLLLDRQERLSLGDSMPASQQLAAEMNTQVLSVICMQDIVLFLTEAAAAAESEAEKLRLQASRRSLVLYLQSYGGAAVDASLQAS